MDNSKRQSATPQRRVSDFVQSVDANRFFNRKRPINVRR